MTHFNSQLQATAKVWYVSGVCDVCGVCVMCVVCVCVVVVYSCVCFGVVCEWVFFIFSCVLCCVPLCGLSSMHVVYV